MRKPDNNIIKVAIADDHALFRAGVRTFLSSKRDVELIGEADNGMQLLNLLKHIEPNIILLDTLMPIMDAIDTLPELRKFKSEARVIVLLMDDHQKMIDHFLALGASSFVSKHADADTLYQAIKSCHKTDVFFNSLEESTGGAPSSISITLEEINAELIQSGEASCENV